jgi:hypothetical protein
MIKNKGFRSVTVIAIIIILMTMLLSISCGCDNEYRKATVSKNGVRFSFDYPVSYKDSENSLISYEQEPYDVILYHNKSDSPKELDDIIFDISIEDRDPFSPDAKTGMDNLINNYKEANIGNKFILLSRLPIKIAGVQGEQAIFDAMHPPESPIGSDLSEMREVYFDYDGKIINIGIAAHVEVVEKAKADFEHILKTFKFLD